MNQPTLDHCRSLERQLTEMKEALIAAEIRENYLIQQLRELAPTLSTNQPLTQGEHQPCY